MLDLEAIRAQLDLKEIFVNLEPDVRALIAEVERLRLRLADAEQQASNAITWQRAMVRAQAERDAETTRAVLAEEFADRVKAALVEVKAAAGAVCLDFETCEHPACTSSYAAWQIADAALRGGDSGRE